MIARNEKDEKDKTRKANRAERKAARRGAAAHAGFAEVVNKLIWGFGK